METKKQKIISIVATIGVILTLVGTTYAYFQAQVGEGKSTDVNINANTVDVFTFLTGDPITLSLNQDNFAEGTGNQSASTYASAMLSANNKTNTATEHYYLYLSISNNTFTYSKDNTYPEILVKITDTNGTELVDSDIEGLNHKTVVDANGQTVTGFDITTKRGLITILNNREITTTSTKEEKYTFTFIYVNYDFNQAANAGKSFSAKVLIQKELLLTAYVQNLYTGTQGDNNIYYHNGTIKSDEGIVLDANDNSYRYAGTGGHPDYYSCSYNNIFVINYKTFTDNHSLLDDCDTVYEVNYQNKYYDASFETDFYNEPVSISWDSENNVCLTEDGYIAQTFNGQTIYIPDFCTGVAYQYKDTTYYKAGIEKVGAGTETLYDSDKNLYTCEYNDILVSDYNNGYNKSSEGNCSIVYKINYQKHYYDKTYQSYFTEFGDVEWDSTNKVCKTINGDIVYDGESKIVDPSFCLGTAYLRNGSTYLGIVEVGSGSAMLYEESVNGVNNFVCFGSDADKCPNDNLYQIIGVFDDRVRLIKADYATSEMLGTNTSDYKGSYNVGYGDGISYYKGDVSNIKNIAIYYWNEANYEASYNATGYYNDWSYSELNKTHLNKNYISYLDNIDTKWTKMIDTTEWKVGGFEYMDIPATIYKNEITSPLTKVTNTFLSKVGLMYVSDYGFAAAPSAWTTTPYNYYGNDASGNKIIEENWMHMGLYEWTMSRSSYDDYYIYEVGHNYIYNVSGNGDVSDWHHNSALAVRPVFHLLSSVKYNSESGTKTNPIRLG